MEAVAVKDVVMLLEPLWSLAEGTALHICLIVLQESLLKQQDGPLVVPLVIQFHRC